MRTRTPQVPLVMLLVLTMSALLTAGCRTEKVTWQTPKAMDKPLDTTARPGPQETTPRPYAKDVPPVERKDMEVYRFEQEEPATEEEAPAPEQEQMR